MKASKKTPASIEKAISITGHPLSGYNFSLRYARYAHDVAACLNLKKIRNGYSIYNLVLNTDDVATLEYFFSIKGMSAGEYKATKSGSWVRCTSTLDMATMEHLVRFLMK